MLNICIYKERDPFGGRLRHTVLLFDTHYIFYEHKDARTGDVIFVARVCVLQLSLAVKICAHGRSLDADVF
jgi:hypothetical protein